MIPKRRPLQRYVRIRSFYVREDRMAPYLYSVNFFLKNWDANEQGVTVQCTFTVRICKFHTAPIVPPTSNDSRMQNV